MVYTTFKPFLVILGMSGLPRAILGYTPFPGQAKRLLFIKQGRYHFSSHKIWSDDPADFLPKHRG
jgi:hypothetical protein